MPKRHIKKQSNDHLSTSSTSPCFSLQDTIDSLPFLGGMSWRCCRKGSRWSQWSLSPCGAQCPSSCSCMGPISTLLVAEKLTWRLPPPWRWVLSRGSGRVMLWILLVGSHRWRDADTVLKVAWKACRTKKRGAVFFWRVCGELANSCGGCRICVTRSLGHSSQTTLDKDRMTDDRSI